MNNKELLELRRILVEANENNDWSVIENAVEFIDEFIELEYDSDEI
jgi:hypothetical protein